MVSQNEQLSEAMFRFFRLLKEKTIYRSQLTSLSIVQLHVLGFIHKYRAAEMNEVATEFDIEMPTATGIINTLFKLKLVTRKADPRDRRIVKVMLTARGEKLLAEGRYFHTKKVGELMSHLSKEDKKKLLEILQKVG